ncbi:protein Vhl [Galleria mellonella]|uniref:Protein Vhl n=1 Tax=Galleria mellonella TaxID=7137 RepID=A0A6J1WBW3_GALME|nr:protein Vhl [Galleria mellonella]
MLSNLLHYFSTMALNNQYILYETNENGERVFIRSIEAEKHVYLRFVNKTTRPVDVWWRDYNGARRLYVRMKPRSYCNVDSYLTHPWEFTDLNTKERYVINNKEIFRAPECIGDLRQRTSWFISVPVRTLRQSALLAVASSMTNPSYVDVLGLPKSLAEDLKKYVEVLNNPIPPRVQQPAAAPN